jgi:hypothetical protein
MYRVKNMYSVGWPSPKIRRYIGEDKSYIDAATHRQRAEIDAKEWSPFTPRRGLSALNLYLDTMPCLKIWRETLTYYTCYTCGPQET